MLIAKGAYGDAGIKVTPGACLSFEEPNTPTEATVRPTEWLSIGEETPRSTRKW